MCSLSFLLFHQLLCFFNPSLSDSWHHSPLLFFPFVILAINWHLDCSYISVEQMGSLGNHTLSITCSMRPRAVLPEVSFFGFSCLDCFHTFTVQSFPNLRLKLCEHIHYTHTHTHTHTHIRTGTRTRTCIHTHMDFLGSSAGEESASNAGDPCSIPGLGRSPGEGIGYPSVLSLPW